ncbi:MAG TPA: antibiotic biosynthesis monooxygenase family protein [Candidatus Dormibacteraeota bacterium]|nr:antibiotic biosynthesis monooxygenase family protein [Candidatus Dormibacteraeota bacterium]
MRVERHEPAAGRRDEVAGVLKSAAETMRDAHGCYGAQVTSSDREPTQVVLIERWESADAMREFHERPEFTSLERTLDNKASVEVFTTA